MNPRLLVVFTGTSTLFGCTGEVEKDVNSLPLAVITSHEDDTEVYEGFTLEMNGAVTDADHAAGELTVTWYVDEGIACEGATPEGDGFTSCELSLTADQSLVTLDVRDPEEGAASDSITLVVLATEAPTATLNAPTADGLLHRPSGDLLRNGRGR